ncbi:outer membrane beta-barrel protein [Rhodanobacter sp. MP1X3]|jgi:opacity protein-like surface antigen|uniref:outer membrane protein n=1 Tax=Rhodanobacter sp. MP1X3 TaxID=2723086 RepID=UPI0016136870|nr:outer membrane beta-barrel protein [Rhodanobacter sp. MP1X3]MBB6242628.1 OOP family OmpA-OmpF porin/outer membrane immunogenic protein [Rhodanobacter sp. MP1X3]
MKKTLFAIALATAGVLAIPAVFAQDASTTDSSTTQSGWKSHSGWYVDGDLGASRANDNQTYRKANYAGSLTGGYRWAVSPDMSVGAELGYVYLGKFDAKSSANDAYLANGGTIGDSRSSLRGPTLGGAMRLNFTQAWYINLRGGVFDAHGSTLSEDAEFPVRRSFSNNIGYYAGVGTGWDINRNWSVGVNYTYYGVNRDPSLTNGQFAGTRVGLDTNTLTASAEYRF